MKYFLFDEFEREVDKDTTEILVSRPDGKTDTVKPFRNKLTEFTYDIEGYEHMVNKGETFCFRYAPVLHGEYKIYERRGNDVLKEYGFTVLCRDKHGFVRVSEKDRRYFAYTDSEPFMPIGINMAFPQSFAVSDGSEFGQSDNIAYIGLKQYETWFKKASENGVNLVRIWCGHTYFSVDTNEAGVFHIEQFAKLDRIIALAKKYGIKLKLTMEQFRNIKDDTDGSYIGKLFNKQVFFKGKKCESADEWLENEVWQKAWFEKMEEYAKRYAYNDTIFAIELWNEMNCFGTVFPDPEHLARWNIKAAQKMHSIFPNHMIINSLGSCDCDGAKKCYAEFPWDSFDFKQVHSYLDQGAKFAELTNNSIEGLKKICAEQMPSNMPLFIAETGAVNDCHSGPFRYYSSDDDGIIFADCVYTPLFLGCACCGNIWHWDARYVESKNLYHMYKPLKRLTEGINFDEESFIAADCSNDKAYVLTLCGKKHDLYYIRNKSASWQNVLRDNGEISIIEEMKLKTMGKAEVIHIWQYEERIEQSGDTAVIHNLQKGIFVRVNKGDC